MCASSCNVKCEPLTSRGPVLGSGGILRRFGDQSPIGGIEACLCHKACITYRMCSAVVTDMTIALTLGVWYVEAC